MQQIKTQPRGKRTQRYTMKTPQYDLEYQNTTQKIYKNGSHYNTYGREMSKWSILFSGQKWKQSFAFLWQMNKSEQGQCECRSGK